jgi:hypothetical protein
LNCDKAKGNEQSIENGSIQKKKKKLMTAGVTFFNVSHPTVSQQYIHGEISRDLTIGAHRETCLACF